MRRPNGWPLPRNANISRRTTLPVQDSITIGPLTLQQRKYAGWLNQPKLRTLTFPEAGHLTRLLMLLDKSEFNITDSSSIIGFATEGGARWKVWDRYLTIDGKKAFHVGNICGTCSFFFERMEGANQSVNAGEVIDKLNEGLGHLDPSVVGALARLIPDGKYKILLQLVRPCLVKPGGKEDYFVDEQVALWGIDGFWGLPHSPKTEYYRLQTREMTDGRGLFEFLVPIFPHNWLDQNRLSEYRTALRDDACPTAVALSILDVKSPADCEEGAAVISHWCLAHYLIDGHHKVYAAATENRPLTLVSFLAVNQGVSSEDEVDELMAALAGG